jgi:diguanylate cyclase (GGDEF)-like protein
MRLRRTSTIPVGLKFAVAVGAVVLGVLLVFVTAAIGLVQLRSNIERLISDDEASERMIDDLVVGLYATEVTELVGSGPGATAGSTDPDRLLRELDEQLRAAQQRFAGDAAATRSLIQVRADLDGYLALRRSSDTTSGGSADRAELIAQIASAFDRMTTEAKAMSDAEHGQERSIEEARSSYTSTLRQLIGGAIGSLLVAMTVVLLLVRNLVPRLRLYARFATDVAAGRPVGRLDPRGSDELAQLGRALDEMVIQTEATRRQETDQVEFADTLQVTASEEEAHELVQRHLQRSLPGSAVVVLKRNNSENRLEAATALAPGGPLAARLSGAEPRTCLALRFGRTHREDPTRTPLLSCLLCADAGTRSTCEPLLVGGQVIGSVVVAHDDALADVDEARIRTSVAQAAPVLGNLRNLALANRSITPLAAAMLDLDHFKQVNDQFGHAKGDEVLAAVGAALRSCLRASDFAGRFGGEELLLLLPDTSAEGAVPLAERIRSTVASIRVPGVDRMITVSIGIADLIQHGGDAPGLLRQADRALYTAKATGRNRVVVASADGGLAGADDVAGAAVDDRGRSDAVAADAELSWTPIEVGDLKIDSGA